jgi:DNA processing protein
MGRLRAWSHSPRLWSASRPSSGSANGTQRAAEFAARTKAPGTPPLGVADHRYARPAVPAADTAALVALLQHGRRPWPAYAEQVETAGATSVAGQELGLLAPQLITDAERRVRCWLDRGFQPLTLLDPDYPQNLRAVHDRPPLIFVAGSIEPSDARAVAVIGSRRPSLRGVKETERVAQALVEAGMTVVSGLARGIDTTAHRVALQRGGRTIAVIGTGLGRCYPPENEALQRQIAAAGAVVSRFWPESPATRESFPLRNALMSGLALANVIVEASHASGTRIQARLALAHGRPVLLMERLLGQAWARALAQQGGVHVVSSPAEVIRTVERLSSTGALAE